MMLQPLRRRTWAPQGQTPIQYAWDRHDRLSVISAITLSPQQRRLRLFFAIHNENIRTPHALQFLTHLHRQLRQPTVLIWDRLNVHRSAARQITEAHPHWFDFEWLPPYAPDLNPVEHIWNHTKYTDLANFVPDDLFDLEIAVNVSLILKEHNQHRLRSCFHAAELIL